MNENILKKIKSLPPLPKSVMQIQQITSDPNASIADLIKVVKEDPMLTANLLKAANSPLYGFSRQIKNVDQAISLFGMSTVKGFALSSAVRSTMKIDLSAYGISEDKFVFGAINLANDEHVQKLLKEMDEKGKYVGAICAAPYALKTAGVLKDKYTAYPGWEGNIKKEGYVSDAKVVEDKNVLTSKGPGTAICFGLEIVKKFAGEEVYNQLKAGLLADYC
jgi:hypothetical protein